MQTLVKRTLYLFLWITGLTALLALVGLVYIWFFAEGKELPHLAWIVSAVIAEMVAVVVLLAKKGLKYLPESRTDKDPADTIKFMREFISTGTNATIVSNRVSWLAQNQELIVKSGFSLDGFDEVFPEYEVQRLYGKGWEYPRYCLFSCRKL
jgi:hypothetical protein